MGNFLKTQNNFSCGEISPDFYATNNGKGLSKLENMDVLESGGLTRRPGLKKIANVVNGAIIVPFPISESEKYLLIIYNITTEIYHNDEKIATINSPWHTEDLSKLQYAQRFNQIFFVHPDYSPCVLTKTGDVFSINNFVFASNEIGEAKVPFTRFDDTKDISITITSSTIDYNHVTFTTSADFWTENSLGLRFYAIGKQWVITEVQSARIAIASTNGDFSYPQNAVTDWQESVFSNKRGWPISVSFHQNRLIFGGTKSMPNCLWMSKVGDYHNFDTGTGLDDEAIYVTLLSAQHHQICTVVSSDKLQVLTSVGEWAISNSPLTPSNVNVKQHTSVGSVATRYLPPQQIEGRTVFIAESGKDIRELDLDVLGESYNATDLCVFAKHLMNTPISVAYNQTTHQLFVVMNDGYMSVLNKYSNTDIAAWGKYLTDGDFKYVCVLDNYTYVIVSRNETTTLEKFDASCLKDADNYNFSYTISAFPMIVNGYCPKKIRVRKISVRVINTKTIFVNSYRLEIPNDVYADGNSGYKGDLSMNFLGTQNDTTQPMWTIASDEQLPATILSVTTDGWYSI